jgi:medium-chain acyl-[acyl-carrier-protein] hydrolase
MDFHGHVNNARYVEWCIDMFDENFHKTHFLNELQINFLGECRFGDELELRLSETSSDVFIVTAINANSGKNIFTAELGWGAMG